MSSMRNIMSSVTLAMISPHTTYYRLRW